MQWDSTEQNWVWPGPAPAPNHYAVNNMAQPSSLVPWPKSALEIHQMQEMMAQQANKRLRSTGVNAPYAPKQYMATPDPNQHGQSTAGQPVANLTPDTSVKDKSLNNTMATSIDQNLASELQRLAKLIDELKRVRQQADTAPPSAPIIGETNSTASGQSKKYVHPSALPVGSDWDDMNTTTDQSCGAWTPPSEKSTTTAVHAEARVGADRNENDTYAAKAKTAVKSEMETAQATIKALEARLALLEAVVGVGKCSSCDQSMFENACNNCDTWTDRPHHPNFDTGCSLGAEWDRMYDRITKLEESMASKDNITEVDNESNSVVSECSDSIYKYDHSRGKGGSSSNPETASLPKHTGWSCASEVYDNQTNEYNDLSAWGSRPTSARSLTPTPRAVDVSNEDDLTSDYTLDEKIEAMAHDLAGLKLQQKRQVRLKAERKKLQDEILEHTKQEVLAQIKRCEPVNVGWGGRPKSVVSHDGWGHRQPTVVSVSEGSIYGFPYSPRAAW